MEQHYLKSSYREKLIEHLLIGELLKLSWTSGACSLEISRPDIDNQGYGLIAEENSVIRHIQLKTAKLDAKAAYQKVHIALATKLSRCVLWIFFDETTMQLGLFLFFGGKSGEKLRDISQFKIAKHTKGNKNGVKAALPDIREVRKNAFVRYDRIELIYDALLGRNCISMLSVK